MPQDRIVAGVRQMQKQLPDNPSGAPPGALRPDLWLSGRQELFLGRYEAPLPTSQACNARCLGCISLQSDAQLTSSQNRIAFTPSAREIAEVALTHIRRVKSAVVSFGQGCEGDP